jgi:hypothetical protein
MKRYKEWVMDILAHALWVSAGIAAAHDRWPMAPRTAAAVLAVAPDLGHMLPMLGWSLLGEGTVAQLRAYAMALPGQEPAMPLLVEMWSHHLHCILHSAIVAGGVTLLVWLVLHSLWIPLLGWWSHILIDIFTHSVDYYPAPVLYPITQRGFDGIAWNTPWFMVLNYSMLCVTWLWLMLKNLRNK